MLAVGIVRNSEAVLQGVAKVLLHSVSLYFEMRTCLRDGIQSNKLEILPFGSMPPNRACSPLRGRRGGGGESRDARFLSRVPELV